MHNRSTWRSLVGTARGALMSGYAKRTRKADDAIVELIGAISKGALQ
jgi:hypothetical protein